MAMSTVLDSDHDAIITENRTALHRLQLDRFGAEASLGRSLDCLTWHDSDLSSETCKGLADDLLATYHVSYSVSDLEDAIAMYEETLRLRPAGHGHRAESLNDLGDALYHFCYHHEATETRGGRCIELLREGLCLRPAGHPLRDQSLHNLARSLLSVRYPQLGGLEILLECASLDREALKLRPFGHHDRLKSMSSLASDLEKIFEHTGDMEMHAEILIMRREVLRMLPPGHPLLQLSLNSLGTSLCRGFERLGRSELIAEAISVIREAMKLCPVRHPQRPMVLDNLAYALSLRSYYEGHSESDSLSEAIDLRRGAFQLLPDRHPERVRVMGNLAYSLLDSFNNSGNGNALAEAISLLREAVTLRPPGAYVHDNALDNLAEALEAKFDQTSETEALAEALKLHRDALHLRPIGHRWRFWSLEGLARVLCRIGRNSWSEALSCYEEALQLCPIGHPGRRRLLSGMSKCFLDPSSPSFSLSKGISCLSQAYAITSNVSGRLKSAASDLQNLEVAYSASSTGSHAGTHTEDDGRILNLYAQIIGLLPLAANFGLDHGARLQAVTGSDEIARNAAARAMIFGRFPQAVELLEQGRGVFWTQALHLRTTTFDGVPENDCQELQRMLRLLERDARRVKNLEQTVAQRERELESRRQLNETVQALISKIRGYAGLDRFLLPPAFDALLGCLPDGFVALVNASKLGHHALLLHGPTGLATGLTLKPLRVGFDCAQLRAQLPRDVMSVSRQGSEDKRRAMRISCGKSRGFEAVLSLLWITIVQPIFDALGLKKTQGRARPRLWWCVTGDLGFLPIHAAGSYCNPSPVCTADYVISSYIPTLVSLTKARKSWTHITRSKLAGLLICETSTTEGSAPYLSNVVDEAIAVHECFTSAGARVLNPPAAHTSMSELHALLKKPAHILHMACHGIQHSDPLRSAFLLQDGRLSIEDVMQLNLPDAFLAFLSACHTAKGDHNAPDQAVHLAASMLFCGFRSVVGTMWSMCDEDGPQVARQFYNSLFEKDQVDLDDIAYAFDEAVQALRRTNVPASRWAPFMHIGG